MIQKTAKRLGVLLYAVFFIWLLYYILLVIRPVLHYHMQQPPFVCTYHFFKEFLLYPGGISEYAALFLSQFLYHNFPGTIVIISVISLSAILSYKTLHRIFSLQDSYFWIFIYLVASVIVLQHYLLPVSVLIQALFLMGALYLNSLITSKGWQRDLINFLSFVFLYFIAGSGSSIVFAISSILIILLQDSFKRSLLRAGLILLYAGSLPYLSYIFIYNIPLSEAYWKFIPVLSVNVRYIPDRFFYVFLMAFPLLLFTAKLSTRFLSRVNLNPTITLLLKFSLVVATFILVPYTADEVKKNIALCDYSNYQGNFNKTIEIAGNTSDQYDIFINIHFNRAITNQNLFLNKLFDYPQIIGSKAIMPDKIGSPYFSMAASDYILDLGYVSRAQHLAYANLTVNPNSIRAKKRLVETNIILGNYQAAGTYLNSLEKSFNTRAFVQKYRLLLTDTAKIRDDYFIARKRSQMPETFAIPVSISERLKDLVAADSTNIAAMEHLQACYLLEHEMGAFMDRLDESLQFYNHIPALYEQAILVYKFNTRQTGPDEYSISPLTRSAFEEFMRTLAASKGNKDQARPGLSKLKNTYMYYLLYHSPKVTNIDVETNKYNQP
jgi:hypothetical protein